MLMTLESMKVASLRSKIRSFPLSSAVNLLAERWRVREVEISLEADGDDLVGLGDDANDSITMLGADRCSQISFLLLSGPMDRPARKPQSRLDIQAGPVPVHEERSNVGVRFFEAAGSQVWITR
jgi:hypothetical protein